MIGRFYNQFWRAFSQKEVEEATWRLFKRWSMNKVPFSLVENKIVLDAGCGSGQYSLSLLQLGAREVHGVDLNKPVFKARNFFFKKANVLKLPFEDNYFDFVFCNGVLHHTKDWKKGIKEITRVLKPNGWLWLYVAGKSKYWGYAEQIREKMGKKDADAFRQFLVESDWLPNKIYFLLDAFFVPFREHYTERQVREELQLNGFNNVILLKHDLVESKRKGEKPHLRFLAKKKNYEEIICG